MAEQVNKFSTRPVLLIGGALAGVVLVAIVVIGATGGSDSTDDPVVTDTPTLEPAASTLTTATPAPVPAASAAVTPLPGAWEGAYFNNPTFSGAPVYTDQAAPAALDYDWGNGSPVDGTVNADEFSARWNRCLDFEERYYEFVLGAGGQARLTIDGTEILNVPRRGSDRRRLVLPEGTHCLTVEFVELGGSARLTFYFDTGDAFTPPSDGEGWEAAYFNNEMFESPVVTRRDAAIDFDWERGNPAPGIGFDNFAARWQRCQLFEAGPVTFSLSADDQAALFVDDVEVLAVFNKDDAVELDLAVGEHCLRVDYLEFDGGAHVNLSWE